MALIFILGLLTGLFDHRMYTIYCFDHFILYCLFYGVYIWTSKINAFLFLQEWTTNFSSSKRPERPVVDSNRIAFICFQDWFNATRSHLTSFPAVISVFMLGKTDTVMTWKECQFILIVTAGVSAIDNLSIVADPRESMYNSNKTSP